MAINSIAIKQIIGAWAFDSSEEIKWMCSQVENLQITQDGETTEKQDANGSTIFSIGLKVRDEIHNAPRKVIISMTGSIITVSLSIISVIP